MIPGVSLITQALYALVFCTRYLDIFTSSLELALAKWNFVLKILYVTTSFYIIYLMMRVFARTREREKAWKLGAYCLFGSLLLTLPVTGIFRRSAFRPFQILEVRKESRVRPIEERKMPKVL